MVTPDLDIEHGEQIDQRRQRQILLKFDELCLSTAESGAGAGSGGEAETSGAGAFSAAGAAAAAEIRFGRRASRSSNLAESTGLEM